MKIIVIVCWHPTEENSHYCKWILPHVSASKLTGNDIYLVHLEVTESRSLSDEVNVLEHGHIHAKVYINKKFHLRNILSYRMYLSAYKKKLDEVISVVEKEWGKADLLHAHVSMPSGYASAELALEKNIPVIVSEHYSGFENDVRYYWRLTYYVNKMLSSSYAVTLVSNAYRARIKNANISKKYIEKLRTVENPIDVDLFSHQNKEHSKDSIKRLVTVTTPSMIKGLDLLLSALSMLEGSEYEWKLNIIGDIKKNDAILKDYNDNAYLRKRVTFLGKLNQESLPSIYKESDLYIVSSRSETANVSMLEAMSCGVPALTTKCGGPESLIDETVATIVVSGSADALFKGLVNCFSNKHFDSQRCHDFVSRRYSIKRISEKLRHLYEEAIS